MAVVAIECFCWLLATLFFFACRYLEVTCQFEKGRAGVLVTFCTWGGCATYMLQVHSCVTRREQAEHTLTAMHFQTLICSLDKSDLFGDCLPLTTWITREHASRISKNISGLL